MFVELLDIDAIFIEGGEVIRKEEKIERSGKM